MFSVERQKKVVWVGWREEEELGEIDGEETITGVYYVRKNIYFFNKIF